MLCSKGDIGASIGAVCDILRPVWDYWEQYGTIGDNMGTIMVVWGLLGPVRGH